MKEPSVVPLSSGFMLTSSIGFIISIFYVYPASKHWGFTFVLFFVLMFVASLISMTYTITPSISIIWKATNQSKERIMTALSRKDTAVEIL